MAYRELCLYSKEIDTTAVLWYSYLQCEETLSFSCKYLTTFRSDGELSPDGQAGQLPTWETTLLIELEAQIL